MAYADTAYYDVLFGGSAIPAGSQGAALALASDLIDGATHNRIIDAGFANLSAFRQAGIKRACCFIAEDIYAGGMLEPGASLAGGFSLGDLSIQAPAGQARMGGVAVREIGLMLLRSTGLMYAGVR